MRTPMSNVTRNSASVNIPEIDTKNNSQTSEDVIKSLKHLKLADQVKELRNLNPDSLREIEANGLTEGYITENIKLFESLIDATDNPEKAEELFSDTSEANVTETIRVLASVSDTENERNGYSTDDEQEASEISKPRNGQLNLLNKENIIVLISVIISKLLKVVFEAMGLLAKKNDLVNDLLLKLNSVSSLLGGINSGLALDPKENATLEGNAKSIATAAFGKSGNSSSIVPKDEWFNEAEINLKDGDKIDKIINMLMARAATTTGKEVKLMNWGEFNDAIKNKVGGIDGVRVLHDGQWSEATDGAYINHYPWIDAKELWAGTQLYFLKDAFTKYANGNADLTGVTKDNAPMITVSQLESIIGSFFAVNNMGNIIDNVQASDFRGPLGLDFTAGSAIDQASKDPTNTGVMYLVEEDLITDKSKCKMYKDSDSGEEKYFVDKAQLKDTFKQIGLRLISILGESCGDTMATLGTQVFSSNKASFSSLLGIVDSLKKQIQTAQTKLSNQIGELQKLSETLQQTFDKSIQLNGIK